MTKDENTKTAKPSSSLSLRPTKLTVAVINVLRAASQPVKFKDVVMETRKVVGNMNRVSFYRVIERLKKAGLIHEVEGKAFVLAEDSPQIIFKCLNCNNIHKSNDSEEAITLKNIFAESEHLKELKVISLKGLCAGCSS